MSEITIGVPVYNGAAQLDECLANLAAQTHRDFRVMMYDNASSDATPDIAQKWAAHDSRFNYFRQRENRGAAQNFLDVMHAAQSKYFLWRAHDDLCDENFLEALYAAICSRDDAALAVCAVVSENIDGSKRRIHNLPPLDNSQALPAVATRLFRSHASWVYGLWERETLVREIDEAWSNYPSIWGSDHLLIYPLLLEGRVVGAPDTRFHQRIKRTAARPKNTKRTPVAELAELRRLFFVQCQRVLARKERGAFARAALSVMNDVYAGKRVRSRRRLVSGWLREKLRKPAG